MTKCPNCGTEVKTKRSHPQNARFFGAVLPVVFASWPERAAFQPINEEHLRAWLLCYVGHIDTEELLDEWPESAKIRMEHRFKTRDDGKVRHTWRKKTETGELIMGPLSMSFDALPHKEACKLLNDLEIAICAIIGVSSTDELLKEHERAA